METILKAQLRSALGRQNKKLRQQGKVPAVLYGKGKSGKLLEVGQKEFEKVYRQSGENTLVNLQIEGEGEHKVLIHDVARHFMGTEPVHVDFYEVDLARKIHAKVPIHFVGTAPAAKELGGILVKNLSEIQIEALPAELPPFIEVNVEGLKGFDDLLRVKDLRVSDKIKILGHLEDVLISVQAPRTEEELAELEKPVAEAEKAAIESMAAEVEAKKADVKEEGEKPEEPKAQAPETKKEAKSEKK